MRKADTGPTPAAQSPLITGNSSRSSGHPMDAATRAFFEPRFGRDFSQVKLHTGDAAAESARSVSALAYTVGNDVVFGAGQYTAGAAESRRLLAHELVHVIQQAGSRPLVQRQHVADTGFRYTPPKTVTRSIVEIQGVVGVTPDGVYGENTRIAVKKYQTKLKSLGLYADELDGKWGDNTETAHVAFAVSATLQRRGYNCAGFAFKTYQFHDLTDTKRIYAGMTKLSDCSKPCETTEDGRTVPDKWAHKFWMWEVDVAVRNTATGVTGPTHRDFHTVGGQTDKDGNGPDQVMSKNGQRPVRGPKPPLDWEPKTGDPVEDQITGNPVPDREFVITNTQQDCFCSKTLP
jgi:hypothetical protein